MIVPASTGAALDGVVAALAGGEVVALPTDTVYGLAVAAAVPGATERLFLAKARPREVELPVLVGSMEDALGLMTAPPAPARRVMERWWPGPVTVVVARGPASAAFDLGGDGSTIGLRCPDHGLVRELANRVGPLAATSANRHREPTPSTASGVTEVFGDTVAVVVDGGPCAGAPSTVVDLTGAEPRLLREGRVPWPEILRSFER